MRDDGAVDNSTPTLEEEDVLSVSSDDECSPYCCTCGGTERVWDTCWHCYGPRCKYCRGSGEHCSTYGGDIESDDECSETGEPTLQWDIPAEEEMVEWEDDGQSSPS